MCDNDNAINAVSQTVLLKKFISDCERVQNGGLPVVFTFGGIKILLKKVRVT